MKSERGQKPCTCTVFINIMLVPQHWYFDLKTFHSTEQGGTFSIRSWLKKNKDLISVGIQWNSPM